MSETVQAFARDRYVVLKSLLAEPQLTLHNNYARMLASVGGMNTTSSQVPDTPSLHGDFMMEGLLADLLPSVEKASGLRLLPTYAFFRVYKGGDVLKKHRDRPACEVSVTLCLGYDADRPWPIWITGPLGTASVPLEPGDGLLYRGTECPHWREAFDGGSAAQVFLHYVDQDGPHREWIYDKRPGLATLPRLR